MVTKLFAKVTSVDIHMVGATANRETNVTICSNVASRYKPTSLTYDHAMPFGDWSNHNDLIGKLYV